MRDRYEEQILRMTSTLRERAALLGATVRRLDEGGGGWLAERLAALEPPAEEWSVHELGGEAIAGLLVPSRRKEHTLAVVARVAGATDLSGGLGLPAPARGDAERVLASLRATAGDLLASGEADIAMSEYCGYLTQSYENMAMVYRLVRSLGNIRTAHDVVERSIQNMVETLECDWAAVEFDDNPYLLGDLSSGFYLARHRGETDEIRDRARRFIARNRGGSRHVITPEENGGVAAIFQPIKLRTSEVGRLVMAGKRAEGGDISSFDTQLMEAVAACIGSLLETIRLYEEQAETFLGTLRAFSSSLDAKDRYTRGHSERVALLGRELALAWGLASEHAERVHLAGTLHDIGKIGVPDRVLCKPGRLTDEEFGLIKRHPRIGYDILKGIPMVRDLLPGVLHHHERWDGRGYPDAIAGEEIPVMARILAIADTFDAMSSNRAYRPARGRDEVLAEIERCAGTQLDPRLVPVFLAMDLTPFDDMLTRHVCEQVDTQSGEEPMAA